MFQDFLKITPKVTQIALFKIAEDFFANSFHASTMSRFSIPIMRPKLLVQNYYGETAMCMMKERYFLCKAMSYGKMYLLTRKYTDNFTSFVTI